MIHKRKISNTLAITLVILFLVVCVTLPSGAGAKTKGKHIKGIKYEVNTSLRQNLKLFVGQKINVTLRSGKTFTGIVKTVGKKLVHLEKLEGKEYYDALIRIENITAIDARFRGSRR